jgi:hypothetical protein
VALAYGIATFVGVDTASFTWTAITGPLTSNPPVVLAKAEIPTDGSFITSDLQGEPTNSGGTIEASAPFTGFVIVLGMDPM